MRNTFLGVIAAMVTGICLTGCATAPGSAEAKANLNDECKAVLEQFKRADTGLQSQINQSYGYAVFPRIGKGGWWLGGAYGRGQVYEQNRMVGWCDMTQGSIGLQWGGQAFSELIVFETKLALTRFQQEEFTFSAEASAVAAASGKSAVAKFDHGIAVYTMGESGLMAGAAIGGQKFSYQPVDK